MEPVCLIDLGQDERHGYVIGDSLPASSPEYSRHLDVGFNRQHIGWHDEAPHLHSSSDEFYIVLDGAIDLLVCESVMPVEAGHLLGIRAGTPHQIVSVKPPIENFLIRVPGGGEDKVHLPYMTADPQADVELPPVISLNLHQSFEAYPIGACLPPSHPNYTPHLDFTCVWGVEPSDEWRDERLHVHTFREEYYFVLKGRLDFEVNGAILPVSAGQILGVRPGVEHRVAGGRGPADVLFVRVPGGRGDKHYSLTNMR
jgi:mannose-6-phosphate isomerase-like protein (cupin superfamily)